ncbi:MAG: hypothetical protein Satyrvirus12_16 [Satyrvirus sp.]|uniref:Uncharacterized protein n=1 Tax=Satyrvirus sp. TaxID=2487771 RepID=A0A3G5ADV3_9VIRU|nr:MAG: hypothetical protein Satyrvirus12_16 [Satyrvirus sp.]
MKGKFQKETFLVIRIKDLFEEDGKNSKIFET